MKNVAMALNNIGVFGRGLWRYWQLGESAPGTNYVIQKLYAYTDGRSNDLLFHFLEARRSEASLRLDWEGNSIISSAGVADPSIDDAVRTLKAEGVVILPYRLSGEAIHNLHEFALSGEMRTMTFGSLAPDTAPGTQSTIPVTNRDTCNEIDPSQPRFSVYELPRERLLGNMNLQALLCDPYLLAIATRYLGVCPIITKPEMWWDTEFVPPGLRPRPFHVDSGCLRWLKVGINLTETTFETPHFVYVKGSHNPNRETRPLTRRLASRMNLSDQEVNDICSERIVHITAPAGSITLADTRGIHKGELSLHGHRLVLYFGLEGSALNNIDGKMSLNAVGSHLAKAMSARPFTYQFFHTGN
jgi:hypothetical protein